MGADGCERRAGRRARASAEPSGKEIGFVSLGKSRRARGGNRGGVGGGYEQTDPDWDRKRIQRLRAEHDSLEPRWRETYLKGLSDADRRAVLKREDL